MPEPLEHEAGAGTPGAHPDASPDHPMNRNTNEMRRMAGIVAGHDANMQAHSELLRKNITCTEQLIECTNVLTAAITALIGTVNENSKLIRLQGDQVQGSRDDMAQLSEGLAAVSEQLRQHTPEVRANTAAMTALKRM